MATLARTPATALQQYVASQPGAEQFCVALSGGMDSCVLLHALTELLAENEAITLRAVHINHGLHRDSDQWATLCKCLCDALNVPLVVRNVVVDIKKDGPEAGARLARYAAFADALRPGEHLMLAQHAGDQAETFLLQALRGSGPDGLAAIPRKRAFARGYMARPLLGCEQDAIRVYAREKYLCWVEDPTNSDARFDRNFLRHEVLPLLRSRWPAATLTLSRSASRSAAASQTLMGLAQEDFELVRVQGTGEISVSELKALPRERAYNVLRLWVRHAGLRMPRLQDLAHVYSDLLSSRVDANGIVSVREYEFRRHRDQLYLLPPQNEVVPFQHEWHAPFNDLELPETGHVLSRDACVAQGLRLPEHGYVTVRSRRGGELIKLGEPAFHKAVKKLLQEAGVPPWQRDAIPLLYIDSRLAAVWNISVATDFQAVTAIG